MGNKYNAETFERHGEHMYKLGKKRSLYGVRQFLASLKKKTVHQNVVNEALCFVNKSITQIRMEIENEAD
jgi:hypothetical protein